ncbi:hypothetical protein DL93DRAFT_1865609 [Clavulina sp. PMI_390]|nr:hypothetical protein DL93DRAFT_1865609 [Clavulina sp. PMI_390]
MSNPITERESQNLAIRKTEDELGPILITSGDVPAPFKSVPEPVIWGLLFETLTHINDDAASADPTHWARAKKWLRAGIIERLLCLIRDLSPVLNRRLQDHPRVPAGSVEPDSAVQRIWTTAMRAVLYLLSAIVPRRNMAEFEKAIKQFQTHSVELFTAFLAMDEMLAPVQSSKWAEQAGSAVANFIETLLQVLLIGPTVSKLPKAKRAEIPQIAFTLIIKLRQSLTEYHLDPTADTHPFICSLSSNIHDLHSSLAVTAQSCMWVILSEGTLKKIDQHIYGCDSASGCRKHLTPCLSPGVSSITGVSFQSLVDQTTYAERDTSENSQIHRRSEYCLLALLAQYDPSPTELIRLMNQHSFIKSTLCVAKTTLSNTTSMLKFRKQELPRSGMDEIDRSWPQSFARAWEMCMRVASTDKDTSVAQDAIDFGMIFILELVTLNDPEPSESPKKYFLAELPRNIYSITRSRLSEQADDSSYVDVLRQQITIVHRRLLSRPGVSKALIKGWGELVIWVHIGGSNASIGAVCNNPGCDSLTTPKHQCARCHAYYCSQQCQRSDWKFHKIHCIPAKK